MKKSTQRIIESYNRTGSVREVIAKMASQSKAKAKSKTNSQVSESRFYGHAASIYSDAKVKALAKEGYEPKLVEHLINNAQELKLPRLTYRGYRRVAASLISMARGGE